MDIDITTDKYTGSSVTGPSPELRINPVKLIDETFYRLVVSNGVGSSSSNNISISVIGGMYNALSYLFIFYKISELYLKSPFIS